MTRIKDTLLILLLVLVVGDMSVKRVEAQAITGATPWGFTVTGTVANCVAVSTIPVGTAGYCFTNSGLVQSIGGSAWASPSSAGVSSWNGQTGAVTYTPPTPPVTSVNGKTGQVVLGATTTLQ